MMTKKQAKDFFAKIKIGERPILPREFKWCFGKSAEKLRYEVGYAERWWGGGRARVSIRQLITMGLLNENWELTEIGKEYMTQRKSDEAINKICDLENG